MKDFLRFLGVLEIIVYVARIIVRKAKDQNETEEDAAREE